MAVYTDTLSNMIADFGYLVGEPNINNTRWNKDARKRLLNLAQLNVVNETRCLEEEWESDVSAWVSADDEILALPAEFFDDSILDIYWKDSSDDYHPLSEYHPRFKSVQNDDTGTPSQFFRIGRNIHLMPKPDADGSVVMIGQRLPDALINSTDESLVPAGWRILIAQYAAAQAFDEDSEHNKADRMWQRYYVGIKELKKWARGRRSKRTARMVMPYSL
jgi:hypothetical protein